MQLSAKFDYSQVQFDKENEVVLLTGITAPPAKEDSRQPLNLVAVLDVSGSMSGSKLEQLKKTMNVLIDHLTGQDRLGIVVFATNYTRLASTELVTQDRKAELKARVNALHPQDCTNISGAMMLGFEQLMFESGHINRVLLLTDGLPNQGVTDIDGMVKLIAKRPKSSSLSTIGFGVDHNPELLQSMAQTGGGNYYYIENPDQIMNAFAQELGGLVSCYAQNIKIEIDLKSGVKDVEVLNKAFQWDYEDDKLTIRIPDLFAEETKNILTKIQLESRTSALPRDVTIAGVTVSFMNLESERDENRSENAKIRFVKKDDVSTDRDEDVLKEEAKLQAIEAQKKAVELAERGMFQQANAVFCSAIQANNLVGNTGLAEDLQDLSSNFTSKTYGKKAMFRARRAVYGCSVQRSAGGSSSWANTQAQNDMTESFQNSGSTGSAGEDLTTSDASQIGESGTSEVMSNQHLHNMAERFKKKEKERKKKKKSFNPMTDSE
jgi:Ca-activated chloride channel family protein